MTGTRRIRVLHLLTSLAPGGAQTNLMALLHHFDRDRFQHAVAFGGGGVLEPEFSRAGVPLVRLWPEPLSLGSLPAIPSMLRLIKGYAPDIIHSHLDLPNALGLAAKLVLGCRLLLHFHGNGIIPPKELPGGSMNHWVCSFLNRTYRYCDRAIAICSYQLPFLSRLGIYGDQVTLIPNGITLEGFPKASWAKHDDYRFVSVASFSPYKNHELLIRAFHLVSCELPQVRLLLVGDGPLRKAIEQQLQALDLQDKITFMGVRRDVPDILAASDSFVLSSRWELHPITVLEAMRAGLPVIATNVGGVADTVADQVSGLIVESGDEAGLARAMLAVASHPERGRVMGKNGLRLAQEQFSNALVAEKIEAEYSVILGLPATAVEAAISTEGVCIS